MSPKPARAAAQHSSASPSWGTPRAIVDLARQVLGRIDLDPFSAPEWNETVGAARHLDLLDDAYTRAWFDGAPAALEVLAEPSLADPGILPSSHTALVNAPGDARGKMTKDAWALVEWHHRTGWLGDGALWVGFNVGQLQTLQGVAPRSPLHPDFLRCFPRRRVRYDRAPGVPGDVPPHASFLVLLPAHGPLGNLQRALFEGLAGALGEVL